MPATEKQLEESDIMSQLQLTLTQFYSDPEVGNVGLCSDPFSRWGRSFQPEGCCELQLFKKHSLSHAFCCLHDSHLTTPFWLLHITS